MPRTVGLGESEVKNWKAACPRASLPAVSLSLQLALYRRQQKEIRRAVESGSACFRAYQARYRRAVRTFERVLTVDAVTSQAMAADIVYVGDYHTLRAAQDTYLRLVERALAERRPVVLALEWIQGRHQAALDGFLRGAFGESALLERMGMQHARGFDLWTGYAPILALARKHALPVIGIDRPARGPRALELRDAFAAERIDVACAGPAHPRVFVLVGQFHVAPCHLPERVRVACGARRMRDLIVYQNCEEAYWRLARGGRPGAEAVEMRPGEVCVFSASPVICQQSFLDYL
jgi:hypothetical protein